MKNLYRQCERYQNNPALACGECVACMFNAGVDAAQKAANEELVSENARLRHELVAAIAWISDVAADDRLPAALFDKLNVWLAVNT